MKDKNSFSKNIMLFLLILIAVGAMYGIYRTRLQSTPPLQEIANQNNLYNQTAIPTIFAPTRYHPNVTLNWAYADPDLLRLNLTISGLELVANADNLENLVCNPYINFDEPVSASLNYREAQIPSVIGDPIEITYEYEMDASKYETLTINLDLTIGPCADYLNFQETNVTSSILPDLIGNYHLSFQVPVQQ